VIATYPDYAGAERAVDRLADQGFAVEHVAIIGTGLRSVEKVSSRMSGGRAALIGAATAR
jgi:DNA-binding LacI/PurR family transcriptional regulator